MKIGVITDSHDHQQHIERAIELFGQHEVQIVFHCGDMVSPFAVKPFAKLERRFIAVYGNNDGEINGLKNAITSFGGEVHQPCYRGCHHERNIFMTHWPNLVDDAAASGNYDLVLYGHTHHTDIRQEGKTLILNPGESIGWLTGKAHIAIVDLATMEHELVSLD